MPVKNEEVVRAWKAGDIATNHTRTFYAMQDGSLWSYGLKVGHRTEAGMCLLANYTASGKYVSQTTSCHVGLARRAAHQVWHPKVWEVSKFGDVAPF